jgi:hypothetical protein
MDSYDDSNCGSQFRSEIRSMGISYAVSKFLLLVIPKVLTRPYLIFQVLTHVFAQA